MLKMNNNLMSINKILLFSNNLIDEDIDMDLFSSQITFNLDFMNSVLNILWEEYIKFVDMYEKENCIKTYYFTLKRFHKYLYKLKNRLLPLNKFNFKEDEINEKIKVVQERINLIRGNKFNIKFIDTKKQCINEEEYTILFEKDE